MSTPPPPPPPQSWGSTPPQGPSPFPASGWQAPPRPPRPAVPVAGVLLIVGGILMIVGSFLPWFEFQGESISGMDEFGVEGDTRDGPIFVFMGAVCAALGAALLIWRRNLAVAIVALVLAGFGLIAAIIDYSDVQDLEDLFGAEPGAGLPVVFAGSALSVAGGIVALAKRRG